MDVDDHAIVLLSVQVTSTQAPTPTVTVPSGGMYNNYNSINTIQNPLKLSGDYFVG